MNTTVAGPVALHDAVIGLLYSFFSRLISFWMHTCLCIRICW